MSSTDITSEMTPVSATGQAVKKAGLFGLGIMGLGMMPMIIMAVVTIVVILIIVHFATKKSEGYHQAYVPDVYSKDSPFGFATLRQ